MHALANEFLVIFSYNVGENLFPGGMYEEDNASRLEQTDRVVTFGWNNFIVVDWIFNLERGFPYVDKNTTKRGLPECSTTI